MREIPRGQIDSVERKRKRKSSHIKHEYVDSGDEVNSTGRDRTSSASKSDDKSDMNSNNESLARRRDTRNKKSYQRHVSANPVTGSNVKKGQSGGSIMANIFSDVSFMMSFVLRLITLLYPLGKWILLIWIMWTAFSYSLVTVYSYTRTALLPICSTPLIGPMIPFCNYLSYAQADHLKDISKMETSQTELARVADQVGRNFDLARNMVDHEFVIRDLRIRVTASNLSRKKELTAELESLIRYTKQTAKDLSRFTAKVSRSIDTVKAFDDYAVKTLEGIAEQQQSPPSLARHFMSMVHPLAAFSPANVDYSEKQVKHLFVTTASQISAKVKLLIDESFHLAHGLDNIQETLDRIRELSVDEFGDLPRVDILGHLWKRLAKADDYEQYKSHSSLLKDITIFYKGSSDMMRETTAALNRIDAELSEFRDDFATPGLILKDHPLEVIVALLRKSGERLETGRRELQSVEDGRSPQRDYTQMVHAGSGAGSGKG